MEYLSKAEQSRIRVLNKKSERLSQNRFLVEGIKLCTELLGSDFSIQCAVISDNASHGALALADDFIKADIEVYKAGSASFERMCDVVNPQGIFAIADLPFPMKDIPTTFLALEHINDPGNLGTIIRTADWFGIQHVILGGASADPFGPKALRASMGSCFRISLQEVPSLSSFLQSWQQIHHEGQVYGMMVQGTTSLLDIHSIPTAWGLIVGSESHGLSEETTSCIMHPIRIDGSGSAESLNVGIATGIALYHCMNVQSGQ